MRDQRGDSDDALGRYALDVGTWELDVASGTLRVSAGWAAQIGFGVEELTSSVDEWFGRMPEVDRRRLQLAMKTHLEGLSSSFVADYRLRHRDGRTRWMRARGRAWATVDVGDQLSGHQSDITDEKDLIEMLQGSETRFRTLVEQSPDAIAVHREGRVVYANRRFAELLGEDQPARLIHCLFVELVHADDVQAVLDDAVALWDQQRDSVPRREVRLGRRDGALVTVELSSVRLQFDDRPAIFAIARDVTERQQLQVKLAESERLASLGVLAAGVAHEINNPLAYVSMNLETAVDELPALLAHIGTLEGLLASGGDPRRTLEQLRAMLRPEALAAVVDGIRDAYHGAVRIQAIVKDLRYFSRSRDTDPYPVNLAEVVQTALKMTTHEIKFRAAVVKDLAPVPPVLGDEGRLCQVLVNLLVNAAQAIPEGHPTTNVIRISTGSAGDQVLIEVSDTGRGIAAEDLPRIFDPFFTTKAVGSGSGLGLSICRPIIDAHGGVIEVTSKLGEGTCVRIRLPSFTAPRSVAGDRAAQCPPRGEPAPVAVARPRLLVVDDEDCIGRALRHTLGAEYTVEVANTGTAALEVLERAPIFDVVLCDLMMPGIAGHDLFARACARQPELASRFVFMTGGATTPATSSFAAATDHLIIDKPIEIKNLKRILRRLVVTGSPRPAQDRRRGRRYGGLGISGTLDSVDHVRGVTVIDYSESGLRVAWSDAAAAAGPPPASVVALCLGRADQAERVRVEARRVRDVPDRLETCLEIVSLSPASQRVYRDWLTGAERDRGGAGHRRP